MIVGAPMKVYCDSTILIYFLDSIGPFHEKAKAKLEKLHSVSARLVFSDLTRLECRVGPLKRNDAERLARFDAFFALSTVLKAGLGAVCLTRLRKFGRTKASRQPIHYIWPPPCRVAVICF